TGGARQSQRAGRREGSGMVMNPFRHVGEQTPGSLGSGPEPDMKAFGPLVLPPQAAAKTHHERPRRHGTLRGNPLFWCVQHHNVAYALHLSPKRCDGYA
ncbi:MAG: hypothetical protein J0H52_12190, partial [Comamonadaceae bacterium]|nr:hypothetical protein [Comamonadaceae bacterium]